MRTPRHFAKQSYRPIFYGLALAIGVGILLQLYYHRFTIFLWFYTGEWRLMLDSSVVVLQDFMTLAISIIVGAMPFLVLGVLISTLITAYVSEQTFYRFVPRHPVIRRLALSFYGVFLPVCECGNIPLARTLLKKGASPGDAIVFMLSAPILNPITLTTTLIAFSFAPTIVVARFVAGFIIAQVVALVVVRLLRGNVITEEFAHTCHVEHARAPERSMGAFSSLFFAELRPLIKMLLLGALVAAAIQSFIPRETLLAIGSDPLLAILAMMLLAIVVSLCSSIDAFFALAYARSFSPGAISAFLVTGPMIDLKMLLLMRTTLTTRAVLLIALTVAVMAFATGVIVNLIMGQW